MGWAERKEHREYRKAAWRRQHLSCFERVLFLAEKKRNTPAEWRTETKAQTHDVTTDWG